MERLSKRFAELMISTVVTKIEVILISLNEWLLKS